MLEQRARDKILESVQWKVFADSERVKKWKSLELQRRPLRACPYGSIFRIMKFNEYASFVGSKRFGVWTIPSGPQRFEVIPSDFEWSRTILGITFQFDHKFCDFKKWARTRLIKMQFGFSFKILFFASHQYHWEPLWWVIGYQWADDSNQSDDRVVATVRLSDLQYSRTRVVAY